MHYSEIFDQRGGMYHKAMSLYPEARRLEFEIPLSICQPAAHETIVDLPSGGGYIFDFMENKSNLVCLESSQQFVSFCEHKKLRVDLFKNNQLPLNNNEADVLISIAGLHHVENKMPLFSEMHRILKMNGRFCIADVQQGSHIALFLDDIVDRYTETGHHGFYLNEETQNQLKKVGFHQVKQQLLTYVWTFTSLDEMVSYMKLLFGLTKATDAMVLKGIEQYLTFNQTQYGIELEWELLSFSSGRFNLK
jgi:SAM-dependent methyltransferase